MHAKIFFLVYEKTQYDFLALRHLAVCTKTFSSFFNFFVFFEILTKTGYFNTGFVFFLQTKQTGIKQNGVKQYTRENHKILNIHFFLSGWTRPTIVGLDRTGPKIHRLGSAQPTSAGYCAHAQLPASPRLQRHELCMSCMAREEIKAKEKGAEGLPGEASVVSDSSGGAVVQTTARLLPVSTFCYVFLFFSFSLLIFFPVLSPFVLFFLSFFFLRSFSYLSLFCFSLLSHNSSLFFFLFFFSIFSCSLSSSIFFFFCYSSVSLFFFRSFRSSPLFSSVLVLPSLVPPLFFCSAPCF